MEAGARLRRGLGCAWAAQGQPQDLSTVALVEQSKAGAAPRCYTKSTAVLRGLSRLRFPVNVLYTFTLVPPFVRDWVYGRGEQDQHPPTHPSPNRRRS